MFSITVLSHPQQRPTPVNADFKSQLGLTHRQSQTGFSPAPLQSFKSQPKPAGRRQQSAPHRSTWRKAILRGTELPPLTTHPRSSSLAEHQCWQRVTPPGQRAHPPPFPFPPFLQSHPSSFHPFWDVARVLLQSASGTPASSSSEGQGGDVGARSCTRKHYLERAVSSKPLYGAGRVCGGRVPSGRVCAPALPGEVCKHSCSRTREPLGARQPGLHRAGAGGRGRQGAEVPRLKPGRQPETTHLLQPPPQAGRGPLQDTEIS